MRDELARTFRRAPLGVLLIAALLALGGAGFIGGGIYLIVRGDTLSFWAGATSIVIGPAILYFVYGLVLLQRWTWMGLATLLGLMFVSSVARIIVAPAFPLAALFEIVLEVAAAAYLARPTIRSLYGWPPRTA